MTNSTTAQRMSHDLAAIRDEQMSAGGTTAVDIANQWIADHPAELKRYSDDLARAGVLRRATTILRAISGASRPTQLPGLAVDSTVTVALDDGTFRHKYLRHATASDLVGDLDILTANKAHAIASLAAATERNKLLIPIMETNGYAVAGEALDYLDGHEAAS